MDINTEDISLEFEINDRDTYSSLSGKPKINSVELNGNRSLSDLGIKTEAEIDAKDTATLNSAKFYTDTEISDIVIPAKLSDLSNDLGFISESTVNSKDTVILNSAKAYTDAEIAELSDTVSLIQQEVDNLDELKADASTVSAIGTRLTEAEEDIAVLDVGFESLETTKADRTELDGKLDKPATPTEKSVVTIDTDGTVGTGQYVEKYTQGESEKNIIYGQKADGTEKEYTLATQYGVYYYDSNNIRYLRIYPANQTVIAGKSSYYAPIVPAQLDYAIKVGVTTNTIALTDAEKQNASAWVLPAFTSADEGKVLGIVNGELAWVDKN